MISTVLRVVVCLGSFLYTLYSLYMFTMFLSKPVEYEKPDESEREGLILKTLWILFVNTSLITSFILQHSVMASETLKNIYRNYNIEDIERSVYNAFSAGALHFLISYWEPIPWMSIWNFSNLESNKWLWFALSALHVLAWFIIYAGCVMMDISELAGVKQVYYKLSGRPRPMALKSRELQRYYMHMRHPSFSCFLIIFWVYPLMSLDRLLVASLLSCYMILMWTVDQDDYNYHSVITARKQRELSYNYN